MNTLGCSDPHAPIDLIKAALNTAQHKCASINNYTLHYMPQVSSLRVCSKDLCPE